MLTHISYIYSVIIIGVYCFVLPDISDASRSMKFSSAKELRVLASEISNNKDFSNENFKLLLKPLLIPRMPDTENSVKVQNYIKDHFRKLDWTIEEQTFHDSTPYGTKQFNNIIATHDPSIKNKLVLSCHFDSKNMTDRRGNYFIAATDSAVPCAIIMDIVKTLDCSLQHKKREKKRSLIDDVTLQVMFFDGEEAYKDWSETDSLYGSRQLAAWYKDAEEPNWPGTTRLNNIELFVLLDLIGSGDVVFKNFFSKTEEHFTRLKKLEKTLKSGGLLNQRGSNSNGRDKVLFSSARPWGVIEDDHKPFLRQRSDLPVLHLISSPFPKVWHTMADDESAIDYDVTDNVNRILRVFVANYLHITPKPCRK